MAKKSKKPSADAVYAKKALKKENPFASAIPATSKRLNRFEVHINKEKFQILGRICKHDKGLPGVSRAKAVKRRKETLGQEFMERHKTNKFKDRRIGKHLNADQLDEEIMNARFVADKMERMKQSKQSRFNLNDDEVLTHRGQTLEEIEQFRDERSDDEEVADEKLDAEYTEVAHFGGDVTAAKDRKSAIEEMIVEQKRRKIEIAKEKDELFDLTEKLDANYKDLMSLVSKMSKNEMKSKASQDDYDRLTKELLYEPRGGVTDKLESEEDIAKKEKERLNKMEQERKKRMKADGEEDEVTRRSTHRSADDLDDGYFANGDYDEEITLAYTMEGTLSGKQQDNEENAITKDDTFEGEEGSENESTEGESLIGEEEENEDGEVDDLSDLKVTDSEEEHDELASTEANKISKDRNETKQNKKGIKKSVERMEIPFTIDIPKTYNEFLKYLNQYTLPDQSIIIERLIKCSHPKLEGVSREKVVNLFVYLLQILNEKFSDSSQEDIRDNFQFLALIMPHLYDLIHLNSERMSNILLNVIKEKYAEYIKNSKQFPSLEVLIYLKIVSNLCSTSDFKHPIVTPSYIFIQHILSKARVRSRQDIAMGLFLVTLSLEYGQISKRFLPAAFNYLLGIIFLSIPKRPVENIKIIPPFQSQGPLSKLLTIPEESKEFFDIKEEPLKAEDLVTQTFSNDFKVRSLNQCLKIIQEFVELVSDNNGCNYLATPFLNMLEKVPLTAYPSYVKENYEKTKLSLELLAKKTLTKLVPPEKKPKILRLLEPRIETVYDDKRRPKLSAEKEEKVKLMAKIKRETKGAIREIRRDTEFIQKMRLSQQLQSDKERREKVKRIYAEASLQQGELNALDRAKKRRKF